MKTERFITGFIRVLLYLSVVKNEFEWFGVINL